MKACVSFQRHLLVVGAAHPRPPHGNSPPPKHDLSTVRSVPAGRASGLVLPLGPDQEIDLLGHHALHDLKADCYREGQQALPYLFSQLSKRNLKGRGHPVNYAGRLLLFLRAIWTISSGHCGTVM